jgi:PAS domain S-box-containing protein
MPGSGSELFWPFVVGSGAVFILIAIIIASVILNQRRFVKIERQKLEALQQREERFRSLIENSSDAIALLAEDATFLYSSPSTFRVVGYSPEELNGRNLYGLIDSDDRQSLKTNIEQFIGGTDKMVPVHFRLTHKHGHRIWIEGIATNLLGDPSISAIVFNYRDITQRTESLEQLSLSHEQLRMLTARLHSIREEERTQISREIHDELGQMLTVLKMDLALIERHATETINYSAEKLSSDINILSDKIDSIIQTVRRIATELRPGILDQFGLKEAVDSELETFQNRTKIQSILSSNFEDFALTRDKTTAIFRIFQETLTNVARHAKATRVEVFLSRENGNLTLSIRDNGRGITEAECSDIKSLGLLGMKERARLIGGEIAIEGNPGKGTVVHVRVPIIPD